MRVVAVVLGHHTHYQVVDAEGYPLAQGSLALCQAALVPPPDPDPEGIDDHEEPDYTNDDWAEYDDEARPPPPVNASVDGAWTSFQRVRQALRRLP